jgi:hypothetical protein
MWKHRGKRALEKKRKSFYVPATKFKTIEYFDMGVFRASCPPRSGDQRFDPQGNGQGVMEKTDGKVDYKTRLKKVVRKVCTPGGSGTNLINIFSWELFGGLLRHLEITAHPAKSQIESGIMEISHQTSGPMFWLNWFSRPFVPSCLRRSSSLSF